LSRLKDTNNDYLPYLEDDKEGPIVGYYIVPLMSDFNDFIREVIDNSSCGGSYVKIDLGDSLTVSVYNERLRNYEAIDVATPDESDIRWDMSTDGDVYRPTEAY
jgi:hypothetical protein